MSDLLPDWLPQQRWFGAKGRQIESIDIVSDRVVIDGDPTMRIGDLRSVRTTMAPRCIAS